MEGISMTEGSVAGDGTVTFSVTFQPSGRRGSAAAGQDLLSVARGLGVEIESICGGKVPLPPQMLSISTPSPRATDRRSWPAAAEPRRPEGWKVTLKVTVPSPATEPSVILI